MYDVGYRKCDYEAYCDPKEMKFRIFKDCNLLKFSKKNFLRLPAWDLFPPPGAPETKLYFLLAWGGKPIYKNYPHIKLPTYGKQSDNDVFCHWVSNRYTNKFIYPFDVTYLSVREDNYFSFTTKGVTNNIILVCISNNGRHYSNFNQTFRGICIDISQCFSRISSLYRGSTVCKRKSIRP